MQILFYLLLLFTCFSCAPYKVTTAAISASQSEIFELEGEELERAQMNRERASTHWLYRVVPRHRSQIRWWDLGHWVTWTVFGNDDDGIFGEEPTANYRTRRNTGALRATAWSLRNPLHNFCFYVIGSAWTTNSELTILQLAEDDSEVFTYKPVAGTVFAGDGGSSFFLGLHGWKPFVSLRLNYGRQLNMYMGWRERGNFGLKFVPFRKVPGRKEDEEEA